VKQRIAVAAISAIALLAACSSSPGVSTQTDLDAQLESGLSLNTTSGHYRLGDTDIALTKVVALPHGQLGLRFVIGSQSLRGRCCSVFPRIALEGQSIASLPDGTYQVDIAEDPVSAARDGSIRFHLFGGKPERSLGFFRSDLSALGVRV